MSKTKEPKRISSGLGWIGGKYRLLNEILPIIPVHRAYLEPFFGSGVVGLNIPRSQMDVFNDIDSELINYYLTIKLHPTEFEKYKQGVLGLVSQEIWGQIRDGILNPKDDIERAYFFYYMNKLSRGDAFNGGAFKGIYANSDRPFTNNDNGLITPIEPSCIKRLRYCRITNLHWTKACKQFNKSYGRKIQNEKMKKGDILEYHDPPYPEKENCYLYRFEFQDHLDLIEHLISTKHRVILSIGGECGFYIDSLKEAGFLIKSVNVKYQSNVKHQYEREEYLCLNYNPEEVERYKQFEQTYKDFKEKAKALKKTYHIKDLRSFIKQ
jgi:DNA adenine methylase